MMGSPAACGPSASMASRTRSRMAEYPAVWPFDFHGVPQHRPSMLSGTSRVTPARSHRASRAAVAPEPEADAPPSDPPPSDPPPSGPNIVPTHAGR